MPTGYTSEVVDGTVTDLRTFAFRCSRAMMPLILMRDDAHDAPIPKRFEPDSRYAEKLVEAETALRAIEAMSDEQAEAAAEAEYSAGRTAEDEYYAKRKVERARYEAMIAQVDQWKGAPEGLKPFMLEQLHRGMEFDCPTDRDYYAKAVRLTGAEWREREMSKHRRDAEWARAEDAKERARTGQRNAWLEQLHASLPASDTDGSPKGPDRNGLDGEAATAGAEGIAERTKP